MKTSPIQVKELTCITPLLPQLVELLSACINDDASLGFYKPAQADLLAQYWHSIENELALKQRRLFATFDNQTLLGCVQLLPCRKQNGTHRAEVEKLLVPPSAQRQGRARMLMRYVEQHASTQGISLLVLDTQSGDKSELFYHALGYQKAGEIPYFVTDATGQLNATSYYYKVLSKS
ncbi:GNAT family N-acetyltransferase [Pseudoalteromonas sp. MMG022]|uniref:GNAT family N-acetyltransferase n=1 Tax=Pseudoalteromonas sp. MMG022 TaxID=2909978 RepID=UPI001F3BA626|nr:GNAT family N-acetyltransferase [Pseudoalteromonas sp. MMG022]MCF6437068.1 GNAT family N-acetyltransferase [Pseudoalteromonas sp. MMG022]